jgi:hypothetical protein
MLNRELFLLVIGLLALDAVKAASTDPASELKITHQERSLQPGEVVLITLESPKPLQKLSGTVFGKTFPFYVGPDPRVWKGLLGIDLETRSGPYSLQLRGTRVDGTAIHAIHALVVLDKKFPTRRLTVEEKYVTPPKETEERIRRESQRVEEIFSVVTPRRMWNGRFVTPVSGPASSSFGRRNILNGKPRSPHTGTDFSADTGTPIAAPNSGEVVLAADLYFSGNTVIIDHGLGLYSFFAHLSQISVHQQEQVGTGDIIGRVGSTGRVTGPHLHWTVRLIGTRVDPLSLIAVLSTK